MGFIAITVNAVNAADNITPDSKAIAADLVAVKEKAVLVKNELQILRQQITVSDIRIDNMIDNAFLEMLAGCLSSKENPSYDSDKLLAILIIKRERQLKTLMERLKEFNINKFVLIIDDSEKYAKQCNALQKNIKKLIRKQEREVVWLRAQKAAQENNKAQQIQDEIKRKEKIVTVCSEKLPEVQKAAQTFLTAKKEIELLSQIYFNLRDKVDELAPLYIELRNKLIERKQIGGYLTKVQTLMNKFPRKIFNKSTIACINNAQKARDELKHRRNPVEYVKPGKRIKNRNISQKKITNKPNSNYIIIILFIAVALVIFIQFLNKKQ